jgi:hypothetical protein
LLGFFADSFQDSQREVFNLDIVMGCQYGERSLGRQASEWLGVHVQVGPASPIHADDFDEICDTYAG